MSFLIGSRREKEPQRLPVEDFDAGLNDVARTPCKDWNDGLLLIRPPRAAQLGEFFKEDVYVGSSACSDPAQKIYQRRR